MIRSNPSHSVWKSLLWLLAIPVLNIFYGVLNRPTDQVYNFAIILDEMIPFVPLFIVPYLLWYPFITGALVAIAFKNKYMYFRTLFALCCGLVISYVFFAFFQSIIIRPDISTEQDWVHWLVKFVYNTDQPYNCFPSIHVLTSYLIIKGTHIFGRPIWLISTLISVLIIISTVLVKQHVVVDIIGGIIVAELCFWSAGVFISLLKKINRYNRSVNKTCLNGKFF